MAILDIVVDELPESDAFPAGRYRLRIDDVGLNDEGKPFSDKNGTPFVALTFVVIEGEHANRKFTENYVPLTGKAALRKILTAAKYDKPKLARTDDLIGLELDAIVKIEKSDEFGDRNRIGTYLVPEDPATANAPKRPVSLSR